MSRVARSYGKRRLLTLKSSNPVSLFGCLFPAMATSEGHHILLGERWPQCSVAEPIPSPHV
jgi:hypothetical protein